MKFEKNNAIDINNNFSEIRSNILSHLFKCDSSNWDFSFIDFDKINIDEVNDLAKKIIYGAPLPVINVYYKYPFIKVLDKESERVMNILWHLYALKNYEKLFKIELNDDIFFYFNDVNSQKKEMIKKLELKIEGINDEECKVFSSISYNILNTPLFIQFLKGVEAVTAYKLTN